MPPINPTSPAFLSTLADLEAQEQRRRIAWGLEGSTRQLPIIDPEEVQPVAYSLTMIGPHLGLFPSDRIGAALRPEFLGVASRVTPEENALLVSLLTEYGQVLPGSINVPQTLGYLRAHGRLQSLHSVVSRLRDEVSATLLAYAKELMPLSREIQDHVQADRDKSPQHRMAADLVDGFQQQRDKDLKKGQTKVTHAVAEAELERDELRGQLKQLQAEREGRDQIIADLQRQLTLATTKTPAPAPPPAGRQTPR